MPDARNEDNVVRPNPISNNIAAPTEANDDLPNTANRDGLTDFWKMLDPLKCSPNRPDCPRCSLGIFNVEKFTNPFDVRDSLRREQDHMTLRGCGRGSSLVVPQESIQALTSAAGTALPVLSNSCTCRMSSSTSGPSISITESSSSTASATTLAA